MSSVFLETVNMSNAVSAVISQLFLVRQIVWQLAGKLYQNKFTLSVSLFFSLERCRTTVEITSKHPGVHDGDRYLLLAPVNRWQRHDDQCSRTSASVLWFLRKDVRRGEPVVFGYDELLG